MSNDELIRSHTELRTAVILAGKEFRRLNFEKQDSLILIKLRKVLHESRVVAKKYR